jgi:hypothetical protein
MTRGCVDRCPASESLTSQRAPRRELALRARSRSPWREGQQNVERGAGRHGGKRFGEMNDVTRSKVEGVPDRLTTQAGGHALMDAARGIGWHRLRRPTHGGVSASVGAVYKTGFVPSDSRGGGAVQVVGWSPDCHARYSMRLEWQKSCSAVLEEPEQVVAAQSRRGTPVPSPTQHAGTTGTRFDSRCSSAVYRRISPRGRYLRRESSLCGDWTAQAENRTTNVCGDIGHRRRA